MVLEYVRGYEYIMECENNFCVWEKIDDVKKWLENMMLWLNGFCGELIDIV